MSFGAALTEYIKTENLFSWRIENFNLITRKSLVEEDEEQLSAFGNIYKNKYYLLKSSEMVANDLHSGLKFTAKISLRFDNFPGEAHIWLDCSPKLDSYRFVYQINDSDIKKEGSSIYFEEEDEVKKLSIFVHAVTKTCRSFEASPFKNFETISVAQRLKNMWITDSDDVHVIIKCGENETKAIMPFLAAASPVFNNMFHHEFTEKMTKTIEIPDFELEIVEKMIEFCETDNVKESEGREEDLFKIGAKYFIEDLKKFVLEKMADSTTLKNIESRVQLANLYELEKFKEWCMQFIHRNNIEIAY